MCTQSSTCNNQYKYGVILHGNMNRKTKKYSFAFKKINFENLSIILLNLADSVLVQNK